MNITLYTLKSCIYDKFSCIASACPYHCCQGWTIAIPDESYKKYIAYEGTLGEIARKFILYDEDIKAYRMALGKHGTCPFCEENGLCKIIIQEGEQDLSPVCTVFPRMKYLTSDTMEQGLSLGCPHVVELLYDIKTPLYFEKEEVTEDSWNDEITEDELHAIEFDLQIRELLRTLLQNRKYSMWYRLFSFISVLEKINEAHQKQDEMTVFELLNHFLQDNYLHEMQTYLLKSVQIDIHTKFALITNLFETFIPDFLGLSGNCRDKVEKLISAHREMTAECYHDIQCRLSESMTSGQMEILDEHIAVSDWFHNALLARNKDYLHANGITVVLVQILVNYMRVLSYKQYGAFRKEDEIFQISLAERLIMHAKDRGDRCIEQLKEKNMLSNAYMLMMLAPC